MHRILKKYKQNIPILVDCKTEQEIQSILKHILTGGLPSSYDISYNNKYVVGSGIIYLLVTSDNISKYDYTTIEPCDFLREVLTCH